MVEGGIFLAKQYRAMEEAWQRGDFFWAGSGNVLFTYLQKKCPFDKLRERVFFVLAKNYKAMDGGLAARRFFMGRLRERVFSYLQKSVPSTGSGNKFFSYLPNSTKPRRAALRRGDFQRKSPIPEKIHGRIFSGQAQGTGVGGFFLTCQAV